MDYGNDPYCDEDGEPLMDFDEDLHSDHDEPQQHLLNHHLVDDDDRNLSDRRERSATPVYDEANPRPRKRLIKKVSLKNEFDDYTGDGENNYGQDDGLVDLVRDDYSDGGDKSDKGKSVERMRKREKGEKKFKVRRSGGGRMRDHEADPEMKEMWETVAGGNSEDDQEGMRTLDDDNFIDDSGLDPSDRYGSDNGNSPSHAPQADEGEEDDEIKELFKIGRKKKKREKIAAEIALLVEKVMAELEVVAEEDAELNRLGKPAINKLKKLSLLTNVLSKKQLQREFLDHGVLNLLKTLLEPLPDGCLSSINVRAAVLKILNDLPIDLEQFDRKEQLKKSGLGKMNKRLQRLKSPKRKQLQATKISRNMVKYL